MKYKTKKKKVITTPLELSPELWKILERPLEDSWPWHLDTEWQEDYYFEDRPYLPKSREDTQDWLVGYLQTAGTFRSIPYGSEGHSTQKFIITANDHGVEDLRYARYLLGYGKVKKLKFESSSKKEIQYWRYSISNPWDVDRLIKLLTKKVIWKSKQTSYTKFVEGFYKRPFVASSNWKPVILEEGWRDNLDLISLDTGVLAGIIDAKGCFDVRKKTRPRFTLNGTRDLKVLQRVQELIGHGAISTPPGRPTMHTYATHYDGCADLERYLSQYELRTAKLRQYIRWMKAYRAKKES